MLLLVLLSCRPGPAVRDSVGLDSAADSASASSFPVEVEVALDGIPTAGVTLSQGGNPARWITNEEGRATVEIDLVVEGELVLMASHPEARIVGIDVGVDMGGAGEDPLRLELSRFATQDNAAYVYQDPGEPGRWDTTGQCAHCHQTLGQDWFDSAHRSSAKNPVVHDLFAGTAHRLADAAACAAAGGRWWTGIQPGTGAPGERCYLGAGALPDLNPDCGQTAPCDGVAANTGGCADCHAPGIDGARGGRDLLEAVGQAYDYGVHCDVCHKVASVDPEDLRPGVAGRLAVLRPSEPSSMATFDWQPLSFGPYDDVVNPRMGSVARPQYQQSSFCAGCHQLDAPVELPGAEIDLDRWPEGRLPVQSTWAEWRDGPFNSAEGGAPCQSCHMPADGDVGNSADLGNITEIEPGVAAGWYRPPGSVRRHAFFGPRSAEQRMIDLAAWLQLEALPREGAGEGEIEVRATVQNVGPGHALPTGEPMRHLLLVLEARCADEAVAAIGGDAVPDLGGALDQRVAGEDMDRWPGAAPGQLLRAVRRTGAFTDYQGFGPFGDGSFAAPDKGLPVEEVLGQSTILAVDGGRVTLDRALPGEADRVYRVDGLGLPQEGAVPRAWAGAPGFAFARVMVGLDGQRMVPHFRAVDLSQDNRLLPGQSWTSTHLFPGCPSTLQVDAVLLYRPYPLWLQAERGWEMTDQVMARASLDLAP